LNKKKCPFQGGVVDCGDHCPLFVKGTTDDGKPENLCAIYIIAKEHYRLVENYLNHELMIDA
jgi:hypothetical protein